MLYKYEMEMDLDNKYQKWRHLKLYGLLKRMKFRQQQIYLTAALGSLRST